MKKHIPTILLVVIFGIGLSLLLYPTVSDYWNSHQQSHAIAGYEDAVEEIDDETYETILKNAQDYNARLAESGNIWEMDEEELEDYNSQLDVSGTGIMGYVDIPKINCSLPIYHGTDDAVLQVAIGHIEGSSLPVGGESTHCVISGHRGLPSAKLFTDLDELEIGDVFLLHVMGDTLTYEVDQILTVLPTEIDALQIEEGKDLCTLVTCTPYGVNTHRLLVRGHRIPNQDADSGGDATQVDSLWVATLIAVPILLLLLLWLFVKYRKSKTNKD